MDNVTTSMSMAMSGLYGGSDDPCVLGFTNGTYPNGTIGKGNWKPFGLYMPTSAEKQPCQAANDPWASSAYYGWWTTYFILAGVAAVSISNGIRRFHNLNRVHGLPSVVSFHPKISALFRWASYPQLRVFGGGIPPLGPSFLIFGFLLFSTAICFLRRPYYRPPNYGSSPLGLRSEWVATAMVPWIYAAATKRNFLVFFSGVSFHRIMTFHKWAPWICLYMAVVHSWAMIIRANRQQPWWYTLKTNPVYWNGFPPLAALVWLCVMSLAPVRNRFYETFYMWHIIAAVFFLVWMYIHLGNSLKSWQYMNAATVLWGAGMIWRGLAYAFDHGWFTRIPRASVEALPANAILLRIPMPSNRTWSAGSHVYLRFLTIRPWESHPFTISSLPAPPEGEASEKAVLSAQHEMVFLVRPHGGMTARLRHLALASATPSLRACLVDGPYGGFMDSLRACDAVVMVAGGSGMSAMLPIAQALARSGPLQGMSCCQHVQVCWAIREPACLEWFKAQLREVKSVSVYVTDSAVEEVKAQGARNITGGEEMSEFVPAILHGRPDLNLLLSKAAGNFAGRIGVVVCGPRSMVLDIRGAVATLQRGILLSSGDVKCHELELYEDSFHS